MSNESVKPPSTSTNIFNSLLNYFGIKIRVEFKGSCLKQDKILCNHGKVLNICIVYEINKNFDISNYPTLENGLFGAVKLTEHPDIDQYKYFEYGIGFDRKGFFHLVNGTGRNEIFCSRYLEIFVVDMTSYPHFDNKN